MSPSWPLPLPLASALAGWLALAAAVPAPASASQPVDFARQILPIFQRACVSCHGPDKANAGLQLVSGRRLARGGISDDLVVAGKARSSYLVKRLRGEGDEDRMPIKGPPLPPAELALIERWIDEGATLPDEPPPRFRPAPGGLRRLTAIQYQNTVRDLFGPGVPLPSAAQLEPDTLVAGSATVGASRVGLSAHGVEKFADAAFALARHALADPDFRARFVRCDGQVDHACTRDFIHELRASRLAPAVATRGAGSLPGAGPHAGR